MKRLSAILMSLVLAGSSALAVADRGDHRDKHQGWNKGHGQHDRRHDGRHWSKHHGKHYSKHHGKHYRGYYYPRAKHYVHHHSHYRPRGYYSYDPYLPLGAALVGGAIGYSLGHANDNSVTTTTTYTQSSPSVSACYRIERYPDGSERRVELPPYECN